jgi:hypothetical protein
MLSCSDQTDPNNLTAEQLGEPNFHTNTLIVATDWGQKTFDPLLKVFELEKKVRVKLLSLSELAAINPAERPAVDLYLLGSLQSMSRLNAEDFQFVQPKVSIQLQPFAVSGENPWVMLGYWPLLSASNAVPSSDLSELTQRSVDPLCAPEQQISLITVVLEGSGYLIEPEETLAAEPSQVAPTQGAPETSAPENSQLMIGAEAAGAGGLSESPLRSLTATRLNMTQALSSPRCSSLLFFENNQFALGLDEGSRAAPIQPTLIDGPIAAVPKDALNPLKALWMIEWLLGGEQQRQLSDKYQTHTVLTSKVDMSNKDQPQPTMALATEESVEWASRSSLAAP